jgi:cytochrome c-type biogenesis protein CcmH/NrfG
MASPGEEYVISHNNKIERRKRLVTIVSIVSFFGSILFGGINTIKQAMQAPPSATASVESSLQQEARGYELVLQREPNNQVALEKLSLVRLRLQDTKGSVELLDKLVKLHPNRQDYQVLLQQMRKQQGNGNR